MSNIFQEMKHKSYGLISRIKKEAQGKNNAKNVPAKQGLPLEKKQEQQGSRYRVAEIEEVGRIATSFNMEHEIRKIKISIPLTKLVRNKSYMELTLKILNSSANSIPSDVINLQDENTTIIFGSKTFDQPDDKCNYPPPFYITLIVHDQMLHNCLLNSGPSHKLMPKAVMEALGLDITKPYHDLYAFESREVKFLVVIKDLVVSLTQFPMKRVLMDVVIADISPKFGMVLS